MRDQPNDQPRPGLRFDIHSVFWVMAVIASAAATFSSYGLLVAGILLAVWWVLFLRAHYWLAPCLSFLVILACQLELKVGQPISCHANLRRISLGILEYHAANGALPTCDPTQNHSWRTAVLLSVGGEQLLRRIRLSEPWDSQANEPHTSQFVYGLLCPNCSTQVKMTSYYAVVDERALWRPSQPRSLSREVPDGVASTVMLIEGPATTPWAKPEDLTFEEAVLLLTSPIDPNTDGAHVVDHGFFYKPTALRNVAWADGSVTSVAGRMSEQRARAILTADGGEEISEYEDLRVGYEPELDYARCFSLTLFVLTCFAPLPRFIAQYRSRTKSGHFDD